MPSGAAPMRPEVPPMNRETSKKLRRFHIAPPQADSARRIRFIPPGQRIIRSVISVWLCMVVYVLRGMRGEPFYSIIAALQCVQPYSSNMLREGKDRIIGTLIGAFWGAAILFLELLPEGTGFETTVMFYILLGIFSGLVIYSTVLLGISQYALFATVVFLGIAMITLKIWQLADLALPLIILLVSQLLFMLSKRLLKKYSNVFRFYYK